MASDPNGWPDPGWPGVPLNWDRDGAHWIGTARGDVPMMWNSRSRIWYPADGHSPYAGLTVRTAIGRQWRYLGPCLTPDQVAALVADERKRILQEIADNAPELAAAMRALKETTDAG